MSNNIDLNLSSYHYDIPKELIAQEPLPERDASRLLVLDRGQAGPAHRRFTDIVDYFSEGDCIIINRSRVVPVRLFGKKETGGKVEVLFLNPLREAVQGKYHVLLKPGLEPGRRITFADGLAAVVEGKIGTGETVLSLDSAALGPVLERHGFMPLPPYIKRQADEDSEQFRIDRVRYQTVYAADNGSIAAPTAGLHFTDRVLERLAAKGVRIAPVVLHVGWGTFRPITADNIEDHRMLPEYYDISAESAAAIMQAKRSGKRVIAVGTTSVRAVESAAARSAAPDGSLEAGRGETTIFIYPGYQFRIVNTMVTNLHLPHSTPLMMVSAFAGKERILKAYEEAVREKYRFFSYGDSMLIL
jgi:S-adenosylmethionine:tRNA ribosyltransferase-isomerase